MSYSRQWINGQHIRQWERLTLTDWHKIDWHRQTFWSISCLYQAYQVEDRDVTTNIGKVMCTLVECKNYTLATFDLYHNVLDWTFWQDSMKMDKPQRQRECTHDMGSGLFGMRILAVSQRMTSVSTSWRDDLSSLSEVDWTAEGSDMLPTCRCDPDIISWNIYPLTFQPLFPYNKIHVWRPMKSRPSSIVLSNSLPG